MSEPTPDDAHPMVQALAPVLAPNTSRPEHRTNLKDGARAAFAGVVASFPLAAIASSAWPYVDALIGQALQQLSVQLPAMATHEARFWASYGLLTFGYTAGVWAKMWRQRLRARPLPDDGPPTLSMPPPSDRAA